MSDANAPLSATPKTLQPGTRVRSIEEGEYFAGDGTYVGLSKTGMYHQIKWDSSRGSNPGWIDLHLEDEFEVI